MEAAVAVPHGGDHGTRRRAHPGPGAPPVGGGPPDNGAELLPRYRRVGCRRSVPVGAVGGPVPGPSRRAHPPASAHPPQVTHGPADPRTPARTAAAGRRRGEGTGRCGLAPGGGDGRRARSGVHRGRPDAGAGHHERAQPEDLGRRRWHRQTPQPDRRRGARILGVGGRRGAPAHRDLLQGCKPGYTGCLPGFTRSAIDQLRAVAPQVWCKDGSWHVTGGVSWR